MSTSRMLASKTKLLLRSASEERLAALNAEQPFIRYGRAVEISERLERLLSTPRLMRPANLVVTGATNNGKSRIVRHFVASHPRIDDPNAEASEVRVLFIELPAPDARALYLGILARLGAPIQRTSHTANLQDQVLRVCRAVQLRVLVLDELNNMLLGSTAQQRSFLGILRYLSNELQISIVASGLPEAMQALSSDEQLNNRFEQYPLPRWRIDDQSRKLLAALESTLPLREASDLSSPALTKAIVSASEGAIGEMVKLVRLAAIAAIESGIERITPEGIAALGYAPPSERRRRAVQAHAGTS